MTQGHEEAVTRRCPRCGGSMKKPASSLFFWHADNNHPRCDITNIVDTAPPVIQTIDVLDDAPATPSPAEPPRGKARKNKGT
ncbi:MAG: hypothetical protein ABI406_18310 [Ktedonobacteraceae bacterium]